MRKRSLTILVILLAACLMIASCSAGDDDDDADDDDADDDDAGDDDAGDDDSEEPDDRTPVEAVNPFIGTGGVGWGVGQTHPGAYLPFGMVRVGPNTSMGEFAPGFAHGSGYWWYDWNIRGFSHTRLSAIGAPDLGNIALMPTYLRVGNRIAERDWREPMDHSLETASPGYYAVTLPGSGIQVELAAAEHAAHHRYRFPQHGAAAVIIDLDQRSSRDGEVMDAAITIDPEAGEVYGFAEMHGSLSGRPGGLPTYFVARFSRAFDSYGTFQDGETHDGETQRTGRFLGGWVAFAVSVEEAVDVKVGISFIDVEQARLNLDTDIPGWDFQAVRDQAVETWSELLALIEVEGGTRDTRTIFYTAVFHALIQPTSFTEAGGLYRGFDREVHQADGSTYYTDMSLWDTFRTQHPLFVLVLPERQRDMLTSMVRMYEQGGSIPKWPMGLGYTGCMVGSPAANVFAGSYLKGITDFDAATAYEGLRAQATGPVPDAGRGGIEDYLTLGYVAADHEGGSVSRTLEFSYNDYALYRLAEALGEDEDAAMFLEHSRNYRNLFNPGTGFFQGRNADGSWLALLPRWFGDEFIEGNAWQYLFYVPHDVEGLAELKSGRYALIAALEHFFEAAAAALDTLLPDIYYWHGNEPDIHAAYVFALLGRPDLTQRWVRWVMDAKYGNDPDGLDGNDDCGTLSAWYVFSALGFYPIAGDDRYVIGSPVFERATMRMGDHTLVVSAENAGPDNPYIQSASFNGEPLYQAFFRHELIAGGGELQFVMGSEPSDWGRY